MRVWVQHPPDSSGKGKFLKRLIRPMKDIGVDIIFKNKRVDIVLAFTSFGDLPKGAKKIVRIDGLNMNSKQNWKKKNKVIAHNVLRADGVIWQSRFCKVVGHKLLPGVNDFAGKEFTIFNGANPKDYDVEPIEKEYKYNVLMAAKWRPHKRLSQMLEVAASYGRKDCCFYVAGKPDCKRIDSDRIKYLGNIDEKKLRRYLRMVNCSLNLCSIDWCPNFVVESVVAGTPVICNNVGGTKELVENGGGIVCHIDKRIEIKIHDYYNPPKFDISKVHAALDEVFDTGVVVCRPDLDIRHVARRYKAAFKEVLNER